MRRLSAARTNARAGWLVLVCAAALLAACAPAPFDPPLGSREQAVLTGPRDLPDEGATRDVVTAEGRNVGHLATGKSDKGTVLYFVRGAVDEAAAGAADPPGGETVLWGLDRVGELYLVSVTGDGRLLRVYWYTPGLFGAHPMVTQVDTATGAAVSRRAAEPSWIGAVKSLRASE